MSYLHPSDEPAVAIAQLRQWLDEETPDHLVIESSGSTGEPKRVVLSRDAVLASAAATSRRLGASGRWVLCLPSNYVAGVQVIVRSLLAGHEPVLIDGLDLAGSLGDVTGDVATFLSLVPTQLHRLVADPAQAATVARLHTVLLGGAAIDPGLRARAEECGVHVVATYGASETAGGCVYDGLALDGVGVHIGEGGRVEISGPTLFERYDANPQLTRSALVGGRYLTPDVGRIDDDGRLHILGRIDDVIISGGVNVSLPAVAARLREHHLIRQAEVIGVPDPEWGQRLVAFVVGASTEALLRDWVGEVHSRSWAPRDFVWLDALPLLPNGKVDRQALLRML